MVFIYFAVFHRNSQYVYSTLQLVYTYQNHSPLTYRPKIQTASQVAEFQTLFSIDAAIKNPECETPRNLKSGQQNGELSSKPISWIFFQAMLNFRVYKKLHIGYDRPTERFFRGTGTVPKFGLSLKLEKYQLNPSNLLIWVKQNLGQSSSLWPAPSMQNPKKTAGDDSPNPETAGQRLQ